MTRPPQSIRDQLDRLCGKPGHHRYLTEEGATPHWAFSCLTGRLVELSDPGGGAPLTVCTKLLYEAQLAQRGIAWVTCVPETFYPPDLAANGIDIGGLAVITVPSAQDVYRVTEILIRSSGFGMVVMEPGTTRLAMKPQVQGRLVKVAQHHATALVCLTRKQDDAPSVGSLVSLRVSTRRQRLDGGQFRCGVVALKDKRHGPGWSWWSVHDGPPGMR